MAEGLDADPVPDDGEISAAWWISPRRLLDDWRAEKVKLYWPTYLTMLALAECESVADLLALDIVTREPDDDELEDLFRSVFYED